MQYPLSLSFKLLALGPQISVTDATDRLVFYVKQKLFRLKEEVTVFGDREQQQALYRIHADRVLDFSARYHFTDVGGADLGAVKRQGMRSLWSARYDILEGERLVCGICEESPWTKVADAVFTSIPILGLFSGYVFHPSYLVSRPDGQALMRLSKKPAFFEGKFELEQLAPLSTTEEARILLSLLMMVLLERSRG